MTIISPAGKTFTGTVNIQANGARILWVGGAFMGDLDDMIARGWEVAA